MPAPASTDRVHTFEPAAFGLRAEPNVTRTLADPAATRALGAALAQPLRAGGFLGLVGDLGAGKTTLVQGLVAAFGREAEASSPTYTLLNEYDVGPGVFHFDLYRLQTSDELETIAYWDVTADPRAAVVVEWIDRFPEAWAGQGAIVELVHHEGRRVARAWIAGPAESWLAAFQR